MALASGCTTWVKDLNETCTACLSVATEEQKATKDREHGPGFAFPAEVPQ